MKRKVPLGQILRINREKLGLSISKAAQEAQVKQEYILAIESGDYSAFIDNIYSRQYLKRYIDVLGLSYDLAFDLYLYEFKHFQKEHRKHHQKKSSSEFRFIFPHKWFLRILIICIGLVVFGYLGLRFYSISAPPELIVYSPADHLLISEHEIEVRGKTHEKARVIINDIPILTNTDGSFSAHITLQEGINDITIRARKKHGKEQVIIRHIIVE